MPGGEMVIGRLLRKARNILVGTFLNVMGMGDDVARPRMEICMGCPYRRLVWKIGYVCKACGCVLRSKTAVPEERCRLGKW